MQTKIPSTAQIKTYYQFILVPLDKINQSSQNVPHYGEKNLWLLQGCI